MTKKPTIREELAEDFSHAASMEYWGALRVVNRVLGERKFVVRRRAKKARSEKRGGKA